MNETYEKTLGNEHVARVLSDPESMSELEYLSKRYSNNFTIYYDQKEWDVKTDFDNAYMPSTDQVDLEE